MLLSCSVLYHIYRFGLKRFEDLNKNKLYICTISLNFNQDSSSIFKGPSVTGHWATSFS